MKKLKVLLVLAVVALNVLSWQAANRPAVASAAIKEEAWWQDTAPGCFTAFLFQFLKTLWCLY